METPNKGGQKLPTLTPKTQDGSQRVIKQIMVIDPKKLRVTGLDLKMAEALKKTRATGAQSTSLVSVKNEKLALAKSILNRKLKQSQQESKETTPRPVPKSIVNIAPCSTDMPPPNTPICTTPNNSYTVLLNFLKHDQKAGTIEVNLQNSSQTEKRSIPPNKEIREIPKASLKAPPASNKPEENVSTFESKIISSDVKFEMKKRPVDPENTKSQPKLMGMKVVIPSQTKVAHQSKEHVIHKYIRPPHKNMAKVIESKVLSPEEKIDISTLCVKPPTSLVSPTPLSALKQHANRKDPVVVSNVNSEATVYVPKTQTVVKTYSKQVVHPAKNDINESAVDFINNLFMMDASANANNACVETQHQPVVKQEPEDATSFLITIFEQQEASDKEKFAREQSPFEEKPSLNEQGCLKSLSGSHFSVDSEDMFFSHRGQSEFEANHSAPVTSYQSVDIPCFESFKNNTNPVEYLNAIQADVTAKQQDRTNYCKSEILKHKNRIEPVVKFKITTNVEGDEGSEAMQSAGNMQKSSPAKVKSILSHPQAVPQVPSEYSVESDDKLYEIAIKSATKAVDMITSAQVTAPPVPDCIPPQKQLTNTISAEQSGQMKQITKADDIMPPHSTVEVRPDNPNPIGSDGNQQQSNSSNLATIVPRRRSRKAIPVLIAKLRKSRRPMPKCISSEIMSTKSQTKPMESVEPDTQPKQDENTSESNHLQAPPSEINETQGEPPKAIPAPTRDPSSPPRNTGEKTTPTSTSHSGKRNASKMGYFGKTDPIRADIEEESQPKTTQSQKPADFQIDIEQQPSRSPSPSEIASSTKQKSRCSSTGRSLPSVPNLILPTERASRSSKTARVRKISTKSESVPIDEAVIYKNAMNELALCKKSKIDEYTTYVPQKHSLSKESANFMRFTEKIASEDIFAKPVSEYKSAEHILPTITDYLASINSKHEEQQNRSRNSPRAREVQHKRFRFPKGKKKLIRKLISIASKSASKTAPKTRGTSKNALSSMNQIISDDSNDFPDCEPMTSAPVQDSVKNEFKTDHDDANQIQIVTIKMEPDYHQQEQIFMGFNETEIAEGQKSTTFRLSQSSEEIAALQKTSSPTSTDTKTKMPQTKKSPLSQGKKKKLQLMAKKSSKSSLENWLTIGSDATSFNQTGDSDSKNIITAIHPKIRGKKQDRSGATSSENSHCLTARFRNSAEMPVSTKQEVSSTSSDQTVHEPFITLEEYTIYAPQPPATRRRSKSTSVDVACKPVPPKPNSLSPAPSGTSTPKRSTSRKQKKTIDSETAPSEPTSVRRKSDNLTKSKNSHSDKNSDPSQSSISNKARPKNVANLSYKYTPRTPIDPMQRKFKNDSEFNPRLLLIRKKEELKSDEPLFDPDLQTTPNDDNDVQCALCMGYTAPEKWLQHISSHYGVGWLVGTPPPLNIKSRSSILNYMTDFFKSSKVKALQCRLCQGQRRSALGLLTHLEQCCLTPEEIRGTRVVCEHCKNEYSKMSIVTHMRSCSKPSTNSSQELQERDDTPVEMSLSNTGRCKRKSVIKAESKLKNLDTEFVPEDLIRYIPPIVAEPSAWMRDIALFGKGFCVQKRCSFTATTVQELMDHYQKDKCPYFPKPGYQCIKCRFQSIEIDKVQEHIFEKHQPKPQKEYKDDNEASFMTTSSEGMSSACELSEDETSPKKDSKKKKKTKTKRIRDCILNTPTEYRKFFPERDRAIASTVESWYEYFIADNYSEKPLFTSAIPTVKRFITEGYESYFPKSVISMQAVFQGFKGYVKEFGETDVKPGEWQRLDRFQGLELPSEYVMFAGGPIKDIAWVPMEPSPSSSTQYLALTIRKSADRFVRYATPKMSRSLIYIQKYEVGDKLDAISGSIHYAIAIDHGPVHCLQFVPSGGYAPAMNRLGLLAVGSVETEVKVYSLPLEVERKDCDLFPIVQLEPSFILCLELEGNRIDHTDSYESQCMCLVWSESRGHNYVIGGYLNGYIAIWDVSDDEENLNRFLLGDVKQFAPVAYFWTMENRISSVAAHYDVNGLRWVVVCNSTRQILFYDLREINNPILMQADVMKNVCNSLDWPVVWENPSFGVGDCMPSQGSCINTTSPMSLLYGSRRLDRFCSGVRHLDFNIWRNLYAAGGENGDIHIVPLKEAILDVSARTKTDKKTIMTLDIVPLNGQAISLTLPDNWRLYDKEIENDYGLVFGTPLRVWGSKQVEIYGPKRNPPLNLAWLMRVNRLQFNPNRNVDSLLAIGYDNGFLRVVHEAWY